MAASKAMLLKRARKMRSSPTGAEHHLRYYLKQAGVKRVKTQVIIGRCIVDIAIPSRNLIIEIDGLSHATKRMKDAARDAWLQGCGFKIVRVTNRSVLHDGPRTARYIIAGTRDSAENTKTFKRAMVVARKASAE